MAARPPQIAGSVLSANPLALGEDIARVQAAGLSLIHFDVMDFHFVPNLTFGPMILKALHGHFPELDFDVHLMVEPVDEPVVRAYAEAGASWISIHPEGCRHPQRLLSLIRASGLKAGLALNPGTAPDMLPYLWDVLDFVLVMTVNPGFGGQKMLPSCVRKVRDIRALMARDGVDLPVEVDGGVNLETIAGVVSAGAEILVVGSALFGAGAPDAALRALQAQALKPE